MCHANLTINRAYVFRIRNKFIIYFYFHLFTYSEIHHSRYTWEICLTAVVTNGNWQAKIARDELCNRCSCASASMCVCVCVYVRAF